MVRPLEGMQVVRAGSSAAAAYGGRLLAHLGAEVATAPGHPDGLGYRTGAGADPDPFEPTGPSEPAAVCWARSGAMAITGDPEGPPLVPHGGHAANLAGAGAALRLLAAIWGHPVDIDGPALAGERAAIAGLTRLGPTSASGSSRLFPAADDFVAVTLARPSDWDAVPAWLGVGRSAGWEDIGAALATAQAHEAVERAQLLEIPAAVAHAGNNGLSDEQALARGQTHRPAPFLLDGRRPDECIGPSFGRARVARRVSSDRPPLVVDLSGLWAGPLAASILRQAGCRVVKVESTRRPDGARDGPPGFYELLNAGKESVAADLTTDSGRLLLHRLLAAADVVVEASRPRAMEQLGADPLAIRSKRPDQVWVSITGYGRTGPWRNRVAFGDVAAVAGGAAVWPDGAGRQPRFCADAYADPVAGLHAAVAALAGLVGGRGVHVDLAMREVVGHLVAGPAATYRTVEADAGWEVLTHGRREPVAPPRARDTDGPARSLGADTEAVAAELSREPRGPQIGATA